MLILEEQTELNVFRALIVFKKFFKKPADFLSMLMENRLICMQQSISGTFLFPTTSALSQWESHSWLCIITFSLTFAGSSWPLSFSYIQNIFTVCFTVHKKPNEWHCCHPSLSCQTHQLLSGLPFLPQSRKRVTVDLSTVYLTLKWSWFCIVALAFSSCGFKCGYSRRQNNVLLIYSFCWTW